MVVISGGIIGKREERELAVRRLHKQNPEATTASLARELGWPYSTVRRYRLRGHGAHVTLTPMIAGNWVWKAHCERSCGVLTGSGDTWDEAVSAARSSVHAAQPSIGAVKAVRVSSFVELTGFLTSDGLRHIPTGKVAPDQYFGAMDLAVDGGYVEGSGVARWAAVTGAGWVQAGSSHVESRNPAIAEVLAVAHGLSLYPAEAEVRLLSDSQTTVQLIHAVQRIYESHLGRSGRYKARRKLHEKWVWIPDELWELFLHELVEHSVTAVWRHRNRNRIMRAADYYTEEHRQNALVQQSPWHTRAARELAADALRQANRCPPGFDQRLPSSWSTSGRRHTA